MPEALELVEEPFHFIPLFVQLPVVFLGFSPIIFRRDHGDTIQVAHQLACVVALIGAIHDHLRS